MTTTHELIAKNRLALERLVAEVRDHHPILWAQISTLTPMAALPILNRYAGTSVRGSMDAFEATEELIKGLVSVRSLKNVLQTGMPDKLQ